VVNDAGGGSWLVVVGGLANSDGASKILGDVWVLSIISPYSQMTCVRCPTLALRPICDFEDSGTQLRRAFCGISQPAVFVAGGAKSP
jgi:hypothetical protein